MQQLPKVCARGSCWPITKISTAVLPIKGPKHHSRGVPEVHDWSFFFFFFFNQGILHQYIRLKCKKLRRVIPEIHVFFSFLSQMDRSVFQTNWFLEQKEDQDLKSYEDMRSWVNDDDAYKKHRNFHILLACHLAQMYYVVCIVVAPEYKFQL